jgi:hypothetical protein
MDKKLKYLMGGVVLIITLLAGLALYMNWFNARSWFSFTEDSNETVKEEENDQVQTTEESDDLTVKYDILDSSDENVISINLDSDFGIGNFKLVDVEEECSLLEDNQSDEGSVTNKFLYCKTEQGLSKYLTPEGDMDYTKSYPSTDNYSEDYIYLNTDEDSGTSSGLFYDWDANKKVHNYLGSHIVSYYNMVGSEKTLHNENSIETGSYCLMDLIQVDPTLAGYLVFYGSASAGTNIDYCESLDSLETFEIMNKN